ncbi:MAG: hypothetical protein RMA76_24225 [Deltaproteobacteria bacterium]|jgi:hypothetical protein
MGFADGELRPESGVEAFVAGFDRFFRVRTVRGIVLPSFSRSVLVSCASLLILATLWVIDKDTLSRHLRFEGVGTLWGAQTRWLLLVYGGATVVTNWVPDYLSLVQSRWVIGRITRHRGPLGWLAWLVLDAVLTMAVAFGAIYFGAKLVLPLLGERVMIEVGCFTASSFTLSDAWSIFVAGLTFQTPPATLNYDAAGIYVYSTFLTSVWLWLHLAASFAAKVAAVAFPRSRRLATRGLFVWVGVAIFSVCFWSARFATPRYDVRVVHRAGFDPRAEIYAAALREAGLFVTETEAASLVVVVEPAPVDAARRIAADVACGRQARRSVRRVWSHEGPEEIVRWARRAPSFLSFDQLGECREATGKAPLPACE